MEDRKVVKLAIRLPADLHASLVRCATQETRSLNGEIVVMLREAVERREQST